MNTTRRIVLLVTTLFAGATAFAQEPITPAEMSEKALLAKARQLLQEEHQLSKIAVVQAGSEKVKQFATRTLKRGEELEAKLSALAASAGVTEPQKLSAPMQERLTAIGKLKGGSFDPDYLKMLLDMQGNNVLVLEELARRADDPKLREFARETAAAERADRQAARKLAAADLPHAQPESK